MIHSRRTVGAVRPAFPSAPASLRLLLGALLLLLGGASAAPARADLVVDGTNSSSANPYVINGSFTGMITVNSGGVLSIADGAMISSSAQQPTVFVQGGTLNVSGGSVANSNIGMGVAVESGAVTISGGSITSGGNGADGVFVDGGTVNISSGSISGDEDGVDIYAGGTVTISGGSMSGANRGGVEARAGMATVSGGSLSGGAYGAIALGGTVDISGGTISRAWDYSGTMSISGGSISGSVDHYQGTLTILGCNLQLVGNQLIGSLQDGSPINTRTYLVGTQNLANQDTGPLQLTCPANVVTTAASGACSASLNPGTATASDGCSTPPTVVGVRSDGKVLADPYPAGVTTITWTATDAAHGSTSCSQTITVTDTQNPTLSAPPALTVSTDPGACTASKVSLGTAAASDNCPGVMVTNNAATIFPKGTTTVTWTATDAAGNMATATQTVTVTDTEKPAITCPGNQTVAATSASGAVVNFTVGATDNCGVASLVSTNPSGQVVASGSTFPVGTTTVTCKAVDAAGNQSSCSFTVTVVPAADLSLTMSASPGPVVTGGNLTYTLVVTNHGPQAAQGVVLTDPLPPGSSFGSASPSPNVGTLTTPKGTSSTVSWNVGTLNSGQSATLTLMVKVSAKAGSTLTNTASVSSSSPLDPNPANNNATVTTSVVAKR